MERSDPPRPPAPDPEAPKTEPPRTSEAAPAPRADDAPAASDASQLPLVDPHDAVVEGHGFEALERETTQPVRRYRIHPAPAHDIEPSDIGDAEPPLREAIPHETSDLRHVAREAPYIEPWPDPLETTRPPHVAEPAPEEAYHTAPSAPVAFEEVPPIAPPEPVAFGDVPPTAPPPFDEPPPTPREPEPSPEPTYFSEPVRFDIPAHDAPAAYVQPEPPAPAPPPEPVAPPPAYAAPTYVQPAPLYAPQPQYVPEPEEPAAPVAAAAAEALQEAPPARRDWRDLFRRAAAVAFLAFGGWFIAVLLLIVAYRFVNPPFSMLMALQWMTGTHISQQWVPLERISPNLTRAVVVAEDGRFCQHWGVDFIEAAKAIQRAADGYPRGASTITMQVAKNLFLVPAKSYIRKMVEIPLTFAIELAWPKRRILEVYLNIVEWGPGVFGAEAASQAHFGRSAIGLSPRQAAQLAVTLPNPIVRDAGDPGPRTAHRASVIQARASRAREATSCIDRAR